MCLNWCPFRGQQFILNIGKEKQTIFLHDSKGKSYSASYFSKWCSSVFIDLHLLCLEEWKTSWWHWPVLYAGYSMHLLVIKCIAWKQPLCICTYFISALLGKYKENQRARCSTVWYNLTYCGWLLWVDETEPTLFLSKGLFCLFCFVLFCTAFRWAFWQICILLLSTIKM